MTRQLLSGPVAAAAWSVLALRWFDAAAPWRPAWLEAMPLAVIALPAAALIGAWLWRSRGVFLGSLPAEDRRALWLVVALALAFRAPLLWQAAAGYLTADGALSGIVAQQVRDGVARHVFVPHVPYSGSLKSHLTVPLLWVLDPPRAFALASLLFYAAFVAALFALARLALRPRLDPESPASMATTRAAALAAGLYVAFAPAFVTHYSLSNDGNYVEVLALGTWALLLTARWLTEAQRRASLALAAGLLLGLGLWSHILAVIPLAAVGLVLLLAGRAGWRDLPRLAAGALLGYAPGLLWNAANGWQSLLYVLPGQQPVVGMEAPPGLVARAATLLLDQWPVLLGYDPGYAPALDRALAVFAGCAVLVSVLCGLRALAEVARRRQLDALAVVVLFAVVNQAIAFLALPQLPGNPRYLLFLTAPIAIVLARSLASGPRRLLLWAVIAGSALGSLGQLPAASRSDARLRGLVDGLRADGVRWCYTDFYLATPVTFLADGDVVCCSKLGPTTTEYFFGLRRQVEAAPSAAFIAVNATAAGKLERKLDRLGVGYQRRDLMKPVLYGLSRKVDPEELFPGRDFPWR